MTKQLPIDLFFKSTSSPFSSQSIMFNEKNKVAKKRSLSLKKTPSKSPKISNEHEIIDLCSDSEDFSSTFEVKETPEECNNASDTSQATVIYSPTPVSSPSKSLTPNTPNKLTTTQKLIKVRSPSSINKYYSPNKKRVVLQKSPVRKELFKSNSYSKFNASPSEVNNVLNNACEGYDDKTIFLVKIINKYLQDNSIKCLLNEESEKLLEKCMYVIKPGLRLACRLYWRKECWYKVHKLKEILMGKEENEDSRELDDLKLLTVLNSLTDSALISPSTDARSPMTFNDYTVVLSRNDLMQICKDLKLKNVTNKTCATDTLRSYGKRKSIKSFCTGNSEDNSGRVLKIMAEKAGTCYRLSDLARRTFHKLYVLMYLGIDYTLIRENKLELTLLYDKTKKETYPINSDVDLDSPRVVFKSHEEFERYVKALIVYEDFLQEPDVNKKCDTIKNVFNDYKSYNAEDMLKYKSIPIWLLRFTPLDFYVKVMDTGIQELKKNKQYDLAIDILSALISQDLFRQHQKAAWYSEKSLVLHKIGQDDEAAQVLLDGLKSDLPEEVKDVMRTRVELTAKYADEILETDLLQYSNKESTLEKNIRGVHIHKQPMDRISTKGKLKYETRTPNGRIIQDVEEFSLHHYLESREFTNGKFCEGRIVNTIFFLLFWDIIYSKPRNCPGIYLSRFQKYPLDMFYKSFYENRKQDIDDRLKKIEVMDIEDILNMMKEIWESRPEGEQSGLNRDSIQWSELCDVSRCLGARSLSVLCRRLALDYRYSTAGFPDLTLWNVNTKQIRFVEVKSDTDTPSLKQIQWMHYLQRNGIDTEFCYVGVHTMRKKARAQ